MGQKKVSKRKYVDSELKGNKSETEKDVPDDAEVISTVACLYTCSLFIVLYTIQN